MAIWSKDIGNFTLTIGNNSVHTFGLGFEFYTESDAMIDSYTGNWTELPVSRTIRFDFLIFFFNITYWLSTSNVDDFFYEEPNID
jgi:hypothetical protein